MRFAPVALAGCCALVGTLAACKSTRSAALGGTTEATAPRGPLPLGAEARSLAGEVFYPPPLSSEDQAKREGWLHEALATWEKDLRNADATLWVGRRLAALGRFREAVDVFSIGASEHPDDPRFLRHRGHRWITLRQFDRALVDLERAAEIVRDRPDEVEPDLQPNSRGVPLESLKSNVYYHLALAHYLRGEFEPSLQAWRECLAVSKNPDNQCSATNWLYMTLQRAGHADDAAKVLAPIRADLDVAEYHAYHKLCLAYKGELEVEKLYAETKAAGTNGIDFATVGYGVGNWHLYHGDPERARTVFREVCAGPQWHAFGRIASEAELARMH